MGVTLKDVARRAGVAISTVSTVLHGKPTTRISAPTQARIREAARKLGYRPDLSARSLRSGKTRIVGLIMNKLRWHDCMEFIFPIEDFFKRRGYHLIIGFSDGDVGEERRHVRDMAGGWVDGMILHPVSHKDLKAFEFYRTLKVPIVLLTGPPGTKLPCVTQNRPQGILLCMRHLHALGRRHIGLTLSDRSGFWVEARLAGYRQALEELGLPWDERLLLYTDGPNGLTGPTVHHVAARAAAMIPELDAIICENDADACSLIHALSARGVEVPRALSVVGFSNLSTFTGIYHSIPLTTIDQRYELLTGAASEMLWEILQTPAAERVIEPKLYMPEPLLVVRESCGAQLFSPSARTG